MLTPALRFDHHTIVGNNWSPSLNLSQGLWDDFTLKWASPAPTKRRACTKPTRTIFSIVKAGCYASGNGTGCYMMGNDDLKAETSINKEIGLEFKRDGWLAG